MATHAAKFENGKFTQGELSFELDAKDLSKALQQVDKLTVAQHRELAKLNDIVVEPFDRRLLRPVVLGLVQSAWYKAVKGTIPEKVAAAQSVRLADYLKQLDNLKNISADDLVATRSRKATAKSEAAPKAAAFYSLVEDKVSSILAQDYSARPDWGKLKGQQWLIIAAMRSIEASGKKRGATVDSISTVVKETPETRQPSKTNVSFYMNAWKKNGLVVVVDEKGAELKEEAKKQEPAAAPKTAPKAPAKK